MNPHARTALFGAALPCILSCLAQSLYAPIVCIPVMMSPYRASRPPRSSSNGGFFDLPDEWIMRAANGSWLRRKIASALRRWAKRASACVGGAAAALSQTSALRDEM
jgi:hypothetical protein